MKQFILLNSITTILLFFCFGFLLSANANKPTEHHQQFFINTISKVSFSENKGQIKDQNWQPRPDVLFSGETQGMVFHVRKNGISYQLIKEEKTNSFVQKDENSPNSLTDLRHSIYRVDINWLNANNNYQIEKGKVLSGSSNYYNVPVGTEPALNVMKYESITLKNVWNGVDLQYFENDGILESDWLMQTAENYKNIKFKVDGATISADDDGYLILKTPFGEIREGKLKVFQEGKVLNANWVINNNEVSFYIENYNKNLPLRIDPPTLVWATYYGGNLEEISQAIVLDNDDNVYLSGATKSSSNIATVGAHQTVFGVGVNFDAFLVKFNSDGVRLWATYYGGIGGEEGKGLAIDATGNIYLAGYTSISASGISTPGAQQLNNAGGTWDAFLAKFDSNGIRQWGTYAGGPGADYGEAIAVDNLGNVYLAGATNSNVGIATNGMHQTSNGGGGYDAFVSKYNSNGAKQWGTYYGGNLIDWTRTIATDNLGDVYFAGYTQSQNNISTLGSYPGGNRCAFYVKLNSSGIRQWARYYGGSSGSDAFALAIDQTNNLYLAGNTSSTDNAMGTLGTHQPTHGGGTQDAFLAKFNPTNGGRIWGTYYGGSDNDDAFDVATDINGNVYLAGSTRSLSNIATSDAYQNTLGGGVIDAFLVRFNVDGIRQFATYYGGSGVDYGQVVSIGSAGDVYFGGATTSTSNIATADAQQTDFGGGVGDSFLVRFEGIGCSGAPAQPGDISGATTLCAGENATYSVSEDENADSYTWTLPEGWIGSNTTNSITITAGNTGGTIEVFAENECGLSISQSMTVIVNNVPNQPDSIFAISTLCEGDEITMNVTTDPNAASYTWSLPNGWVGESTTNMITAIAGSNGGDVTVFASNFCGNSTSQSINIIVNELPVVTYNQDPDLLCINSGIIALETVSPLGGIFNGSGVNESEFNPAIAGIGVHEITYTYTDENGCTNHVSQEISVETCVGLDDQANQFISIFPNPFNSEFTISIQKDGNHTIELLNSIGQKLKTFENIQRSITISTADLSSGLYYVRITGMDLNYKLIKY